MTALSNSDLGTELRTKSLETKVFTRGESYILLPIIDNTAIALVLGFISINLELHNPYTRTI